MSENRNITVQQDLTGKNEGQTQFNVSGKRQKPRQMQLSDEQDDERLKEWEKWITQKPPYGR